MTSTLNRGPLHTPTLHGAGSSALDQRWVRIVPQRRSPSWPPVMSESYGAVRGGKSPKVNCLCATLHVCYPGMGDLVEDRAVFALLVASSRYVERLRLGHEGRHAAVNVEEMAAAHVSPRPVARAASQVWYTFHPDGRTEDTIVW